MGSSVPKKDVETVPQVYVTDIQQDRKELVEEIREQLHPAQVDHPEIKDRQATGSKALMDSISFASKLNR